MHGAKVVVVTGTSQGFGRQIALELGRRGHIVVATARRPSDLDGLRAEAPGMDGALFDITDFEGVTRALAEVESRHGRIDALVNNAGYGLYGPIEALDEAEVLRQFDTNAVGPWRTTRAVLPGMRRRGSGLILNVTSGAARLPIPLMGMYCASKAALHMWSEVLAYEVKRFGVRVVVVEPGAYRTGWQTESLAVADGGAELPYRERVRAALRAFREHAAQMPEPDPLARAVADLVEAEAPRFHQLIAPPDGEALLRRVVPLTAEQRDSELRGKTPFFPDI
jgi:NAD(P)-dependent dehydrogenase (short-subunit alcohol dehydrogenase family)